MTQEFDYIIAGGGTAGCVIASRLKQANPSLSIALIERGKNDASNEMILNPLAVAGLKDIGLDSVALSEPQPHLNNRRMELHAGNVLSGSSAVNYGLWMRGHRKDYEEWHRISGDERWSYEGLLPYFRRTETHFDPEGDKTQHGFEGPMKTRSNREFPLRKVFAEGYTSLGQEYNHDQNGGNPFGYGPLVENWSPRRQPASLVYNLTGVKIISDAYAKRILIEQAEHDGGTPRAVGVEVITEGSQGHQMWARKEVIVSCGAYRTPQLLMLSGIGPKQELSKLCVPLIADVPDVGSNLFDHLGCSLCFKLGPKAAEEGLAVGNGKFMSNPKHLEGLTAEWSSIDILSPEKLKEALQLDSSHSMISKEQIAALQKHRAHIWTTPNYMPISLGGNYNVVPDGEHISIISMNFQPTSRGTITLKSTAPEDPLLINPNYVATHHDRLAMREGVRSALRLSETPAVKAYVVAEEPPIGKAPVTSASSDEEIDSRIQDNSRSIQHPQGTAAMGKVVDSKLRVKHIDGLRVCDASVFPAPVAATTQATVYAVAESLADLLLQEG